MRWRPDLTRARDPALWRHPASALILAVLAGLALTALALWLSAANPMLDWPHHEDWSGRSINFNRDMPEKGSAGLAPTPAVALWIGLSALAYTLIADRRRRAAGWTPYVALVLLGWLALDLRWQWTLGQRLAATQARYAELTPDQRLAAAPDGRLLALLDGVRQSLPDPPDPSARLFILTRDPRGYLALRTRYHLLPHNGYPIDRLAPGMARAGDHLLLLRPLPDVSFDDRHDLLILGETRIPVDWRHDDPRLGVLLRVREAP